jgi:hypothetical protein
VTDRVVVFLDYQNVYRGARSAFHAISRQQACPSLWIAQR